MSHPPVNPVKLLGIMLTVGAMSLTGAYADSFSQTNRPANSYRTDLWDREFQERNEESSKDKEAEAGVAQPGRRLQQGKDEDWGPIPGHVQLSDITDETPFAEWKIDQSASPRFKHFSSGPTAWMMSRIQTRGSGFQVETPHSNGPSMLTLLVAVIACMVMVGALFAEH